MKPVRQQPLQERRKIIQGKEKSNVGHFGGNQVLRQWDDVAKSIQIPVTQGINIRSFSMLTALLKINLVVKFANKQDIKQWDRVTFENLEVFEDIRKCSVSRK